jgi:predicted nucleic acid-binding protein
MILLDTNVVSDTYQPDPNLSVRSWLAAQRPAELFICAPVLAELRYGAERLPEGGRRRRLEGWISKLEDDGFLGRILPFDQGAAIEFGRIFHRRKIAGRPIGIMDALIAAIARANGAAVATRDVNDFRDLDFEVINPFEFTSA